MDTKERPLIILGAGASHDFAHTDVRRFRVLPITDNLINREYLDYDIARRYEEVTTLFSKVIPIILAGKRNRSFEEVLGDVTDHGQLSALRFYLAEFFQAQSANLRGEIINNYRSLIDLILKGKAGGADIITFNYDDLLEQQFGESRSFIKMNDYIESSQPIKIVKIHGSMDWSYVQRKNLPDEHLSAFEYLKSNPGFTGETHYTNTDLNRFVEGSFHRIPAIAIPTNADKSFICPKEHIDYLSEALAKASRVLIIGWKAGDPYLLKLMSEAFERKIPTFIVTGQSDVQSVKDNLAKVRNLEIAGEVVGFSNFIGSPMAKTFFG